MNTTGWICPKCKKVWAPVVLECTDCNCADHLRGGAIPYDPFEISPYIGDPLLPNLPPTVCATGVCLDRFAGGFFVN